MSKMKLLRFSKAISKKVNLRIIILHGSQVLGRSQLEIIKLIIILNFITFIALVSNIFNIRKIKKFIENNNIYQFYPKMSKIHAIYYLEKILDLKKSV